MCIQARIRCVVGEYDEGLLSIPSTACRVATLTKVAVALEDVLSCVVTIHLRRLLGDGP